MKKKRNGPQRISPRWRSASATATPSPRRASRRMRVWVPRLYMDHLLRGDAPHPDPPPTLRREGDLPTPRDRACRGHGDPEHARDRPCPLARPEDAGEREPGEDDRERHGAALAVGRLVGARLLRRLLPQ